MNTMASPLQTFIDLVLPIQLRELFVKTMSLIFKMLKKHSLLVNETNKP